jgi:hypothetical protein
MLALQKLLAAVESGGKPKLPLPLSEIRTRLAMVDLPGHEATFKRINPLVVERDYARVQRLFDGNRYGGGSVKVQGWQLTLAGFNNTRSNVYENRKLKEKPGYLSEDAWRKILATREMVLEAGGPGGVVRFETLFKQVLNLQAAAQALGKKRLSASDFEESHERAAFEKLAGWARSVDERKLVSEIRDLVFEIRRLTKPKK